MSLSAGSKLYIMEDQLLQIKAIRCNSGLDPYSGPWGKPQIIHLLKRTMFGAKKSDVDHFLSMSLSETISELLGAPAVAPDPPINYYSNAQVIDPDVPLGQTWVNAPENPLINFARKNSFRAWWIGQMSNQTRSLQEKMTLFWHNHFATQLEIYQSARFGYRHNALLRANALGNFKELTRLITIDPAMLFYLNGYLNQKFAPDENYGRELQELFTVGKGPDSQYTEDDVKAAARVLTGYQINVTTANYYFTPSRHDTTNKQFSAFYNNTVINGQSGAAGEQELNSLLDMIFNVQEVAKFLCRKLYRFFVYYEIDAATESNVIEPLAEIFRNNNYDIAPVLEALFSSEHFFDPINMGCVIKSPVDFMVALVREWNIAMPDASQYVTQYKIWLNIFNYTFAIGQAPGDPPNVAGWPAYYQIPVFHELWVNTDSYPKRIQIADALVLYGVTIDTFKVKIDPVGYAASLDNPADPDALIDDSLALLFRIDVSQNVKNYLRAILLSGQSDPGYWSTAWLDYTGNPGNPTYYNIVFNRLRAFYKYILDLEEFHLS